MKRQSKIRKLKRLEEINTLLAGDFIYSLNFGKMVYLGSEDPNVYYCFARQIDEDIFEHLECKKEEISLGKHGCIILNNPIVTRVNKSDNPLYVHLDKKLNPKKYR